MQSFGQIIYSFMVNESTGDPIFIHVQYSLPGKHVKRRLENAVREFGNYIKRNPLRKE